MSEEFNLSDFRRRMDGAVSSLKTEFSGLRTGRANPALLDNIKVWKSWMEGVPTA